MRPPFALTALLTATCLLLGGCGGIGERDGRAFVVKVRTTVPSSSSYPDDQLLAMAEKVCEVGSRVAGVPLLRTYGGLTDADRRRIATLALRAACPTDD